MAPSSSREVRFVIAHSLQNIWSGRRDSNSRSRAPQTRAFNQPGHSPILAARRGVEPRPLAFQTSTLPSSSRAKTIVDDARLELAFHGCRPWVIPLYEPPIWGEMRESNSRDWIHNPAPKPFGQSRHKTWSWSSESNTRRRGTSSLHSHCARPANIGAGTQPRTAVGRLPCACSSR